MKVKFTGYPSTATNALTFTVQDGQVGKIIAATLEQASKALGSIGNHPVEEEIRTHRVCSKAFGDATKNTAHKVRQEALNALRPIVEEVQKRRLESIPKEQTQPSPQTLNQTPQAQRGSLAASPQKLKALDYLPAPGKQVSRNARTQPQTLNLIFDPTEEKLQKVEALKAQRVKVTISQSLNIEADRPGYYSSPEHEGVITEISCDHREGKTIVTTVILEKTDGGRKTFCLSQGSIRIKFEEEVLTKSEEPLRKLHNDRSQLPQGEEPSKSLIGKKIRIYEIGRQRPIREGIIERIEPSIEATSNNWYIFFKGDRTYGHAFPVSKTLEYEVVEEQATISRRDQLLDQLGQTLGELKQVRAGKS